MTAREPGRNEILRSTWRQNVEPSKAEKAALESGVAPDLGSRNVRPLIAAGICPVLAANTADDNVAIGRLAGLTSEARGYLHQSSRLADRSLLFIAAPQHDLRLR